MKLMEKCFLQVPAEVFLPLYLQSIISYDQIQVVFSGQKDPEVTFII